MKKTIAGIVLVLLVCLFVYLRFIKPDAVVTKQATQVRTADPNPPIFEDDENVLVSDSSGRVTRVRVPEADKVEGVIRADLTDRSDSLEALVLTVDRLDRGFFPEVFNRPSVRVRSIGRGGERITYTRQPRSWFEFEFTPLVGATYDANVQPSVGVSVLRAWFLHGALIAQFDEFSTVKPGASVLIALRENLYIGGGPVLDFETQTIQPQIGLFYGF